MRERLMRLPHHPVALALVVFVAATTAGLVAWLVLAHRGSGGETTPPSPAAQAVLQYFADLDAHDCQSAYQLLTDPLRARSRTEDAFCIAAQAQPNRSVVVASVMQPSAVRAVVVLIVTKHDGTVRRDQVVALMSSGRWKVSDIAAVSDSGVTLFDVDGAVMQIRNDYGQRTGVMLTTLTCAQHGTIPAGAGTVIPCAYVDASGTAGTLAITVRAGGAYTWATTASSPAAVTPSPSV
ncbi:MAG: hypothetical protein ABR498_08910 [Candidatus Dormibacteria bacterium]